MRLISFLFLLFTSIHAEAKLKASFPGVNAIYGVDDREFISKSSPTNIQDLGRSVALIVSSDFIENGPLSSNVKARTMEEGLNFCNTEKFSKTLSVSGCTGFLVTENLLATAGHCFETNDDCLNKKIIFDVDTKTQTSTGYKVLTKNIFSCVEIIANAKTHGQDFALIKLDRMTSGRTPFKLHRDSKNLGDEQVFMIGHPFGMPLMLSQKADVSDNSGAKEFIAGLDSFEGNSGSPVINAKTYQVEGILVSGQQDLVKDSQLGCYRNIQYDNAGGEIALRVSELPLF